MSDPYTNGGWPAPSPPPPSGQLPSTQPGLAGGAPRHPSGGGQFLKVLVVIAGCIVVGLLGVIAFLLLSGPANRADDGVDTPTTAPTPDTAPAMTANSATPVSEASTPVNSAAADLTDTQRSAASAARDRLLYTATSREALIMYLTTDRVQGTFSKADAVAAVDSLGVDWEIQATQAAESYIESANISQTRLVDQLMFEKFTAEQTQGAVDGLDVDWVAEAQGAATTYAEYTAVSRSKLLRLLTAASEGFSPEEAQQGVDAAKIDWNAEAAEAAAEQLDVQQGLTCDELVAELTDDLHGGFTKQQAEYGAGTTDVC